MSETSATSLATSTASQAASSGLSAPPQYRSVGIVLAVSSGVLIGSSFVFKKKGLIRSQKGGPAGEGVAYLKSALWWTGMIMMIIGELCNFGAYAFVEAIIVTPLGALSVVICAILSSIFLNEKLTFFGWIGCIQCIIGSIVIALNAPEEQSVTTIAEFKKLFLAPGFLSFGGVVIVVALAIIFWFAPRYGKKSMLWYILVCSLIGGLSVSCTQGLGASIVTSIRGENQFKNWFIYFLIVFVTITLLTEIYYLNVALALFNTAMVTPTYYVIFTFCTLVTSIILYQGLHATVAQILTVVLGFLMICTGITILQMSKVDPRKLQHLDRRTTLLLAAARQEIDHPHSRPSSSSLVRRRNVPSENGHGQADVEKQGPEPDEDGWDVCSLAETEEPGMDSLRGGFSGAIGTMVRARRRSTIVREGRARRNTITSQASGFSHGSRPSDEAGHAGIGTKRFREAVPPLPQDSAARIEAARRGNKGSSGSGAVTPTPYGPSLGSGPAHVIGDLREEPAVLRMLEMGDLSTTRSRTPDTHQPRPSTSGGVHFRDQNASSATLAGRQTPDHGRRTPDAYGRRTPDRARTPPVPDPLRTGTPDPNNPGTYVIRVPAPSGTMSAVPRRVVSPTGSLSRTPTPTRQEWKKAGGAMGSSKGAGASTSNLATVGPARILDDGDASRVPRVSSSVSTVPDRSVRAPPTATGYFPAIPSPGDEATEEESMSGEGLTAPPALGDRNYSGLAARSDRATVADSMWVPTNSPEQIGGAEAGEVKTGRAVFNMDGETVTSEGVERSSAENGEAEGSESAASGHALLRRYR